MTKKKNFSAEFMNFKNSFAPAIPEKEQKDKKEEDRKENEPIPSHTDLPPSLPSTEKLFRISAMVPLSIKMQIRRRLLDTPGETEKTLILRALRAYGFQIDEDHLVDSRGQR